MKLEVVPVASDSVIKLGDLFLYMLKPFLGLISLGFDIREPLLNISKGVHIL
jgi:hypothetical protein